MNLPATQDMLFEGKVVRTVPKLGLVYLAECSSGREIGFSLSQLDSYRGESFAEAGAVAGATFYFEATEDGRLTFVSRTLPDGPLTRATAASA